MDQVDTYIEKRRQHLRAELEGVNLSRLADVSGISRATLWRIRTERTEASPKTIARVEAGLARMETAA